MIVLFRDKGLYSLVVLEEARAVRAHDVHNKTYPTMSLPVSYIVPPAPGAPPEFTLIGIKSIIHDNCKVQAKIVQT